MDTEEALKIIAKFPLDHGSPTPLYQQLEQRLLQIIATGSFNESTPLPTELELCHTFGLSRATVRRCFQDLVESGAVVRHRGRGTFVTVKNQGQDDLLLNFSTEQIQRGHTPSSKVLSFKKKKSNKEISACLAIPVGSETWEIRRLRCSDNKPIHLAIAYIPTAYCPNLKLSDLEGSLYACITESTGALPIYSDEIYEAVLLDAREAELLQTRTGMPGIRILRTTYDSFNRCFEASILIGSGPVNRFRVITTASNSDMVRFQKL